MFEIALSKAAARRLTRRMPRNVADLVRAKLTELATDPFLPRNTVGKLIGRPEFRLVVGDWRVLFEIDEARRMIDVKVIEPRGKVYR